MTCEHTDCHCQSEVGIEREGRTYCSLSCANGASSDRRRAPQALGDAGSRRRQENCGCGHVGCSGADELRASA